MPVWLQYASCLCISWLGRKKKSQTGLWDEFNLPLNRSSRSHTLANLTKQQATSFFFFFLFPDLCDKPIYHTNSQPQRVRFFLVKCAEVFFLLASVVLCCLAFGWVEATRSVTMWESLTQRFQHKAERADFWALPFVLLRSPPPSPEVRVDGRHGWVVTLEELGSWVFGQRGCRKPSEGRRCLFAPLLFFEFLPSHPFGSDRRNNSRFVCQSSNTGMLKRALGRWRVFRGPVTSCVVLAEVVKASWAALPGGLERGPTHRWRSVANSSHCLHSWGRTLRRVEGRRKEKRRRANWTGGDLLGAGWKVRREK